MVKFLQIYYQQKDSALQAALNDKKYNFGKTSKFSKCFYTCKNPELSVGIKPTFFYVQGLHLTLTRATTMLGVFG